MSHPSQQMGNLSPPNTPFETPPRQTHATSSPTIDDSPAVSLANSTGTVIHHVASSPAKPSRIYSLFPKQQNKSSTVDLLQALKTITPTTEKINNSASVTESDEILCKVPAHVDIFKATENSAYRTASGSYEEGIYVTNLLFNEEVDNRKTTKRTIGKRIQQWVERTIGGKSKD